MTDVNQVAREFVNYYYGVFDKDRTQLQSLYQNQSTLTFEGLECKGIEAIVKKLVELPFQKVQHAITTIDAQNSFPNAIHILVTGELKVDDEAVPHKFSQTFQLVQNGNSFYVHNDMFRLNYS
ncbi:nuclear envelope protein [Rozella allomycis CSF55]|uniref:Nuclear transport factor 2 n=1 Tax=Rozella allomycis (strain CSF55) TaxID=988480 RepID=A0A4P9YPH0_ROZAC|nr:nuclear envelope protein [Rozella allomycis CSF55]